jgi:hypothetical protein
MQYKHATVKLEMGLAYSPFAANVEDTHFPKCYESIIHGRSDSVENRLEPHKRNRVGKDSWRSTIKRPGADGTDSSIDHNNPHIVELSEEDHWSTEGRGD